MKTKKKIITILIALLFIVISYTTVKANEENINNVNIVDNAENENDVNNTNKENIINNIDNSINIDYIYNSEQNTVTAKVTSNIPMKDTKSTWTLSKDKKVYTKTFNTNQNYSTPFTQSNGKVVNIEINITQVKNMELTSTNEYNAEENTVTAIVTSNVPMKDTKSTWKLSKDKKVYTKTFNANQNYSTPFTQSNGKVVNFEINITQVKDMELTNTYEYNEEENTVIATVTSNVPMKDTKSTWTLSKDRKVYTKTFNTNQIYSTPFTGTNEKSINNEINITQIKPMELTAEYEYNETKTWVKIKVTSNFKMKDTKSTWELSKDQKTYTKTFGFNTNYSTNFTQINGTSKSFNININQIREFKLTTNYLYSGDRRSVKVTVNSNFAMQNNKSTWNFSADRKTATKTFVDNTRYSTPFIDEYGREIILNINIDKIVKGPILIADVTLNSPGSGAARNVNLSIASNTINGRILKPGEIFKWSQVVGPATTQKGYKMAAVFQGNTVTQGIGGGICQVSSTLFQAVRNIGLNIIERHTHSLPVSYTTLGNDATVSHGSLDFVFQNNKPYSIKIEMSAGAGTVNCKIYQL